MVEIRYFTGETSQCRPFKSHDHISMKYLSEWLYMNDIEYE